MAKAIQALTALPVGEDAAGRVNVRVCSSWNNLELFREKWNDLLATTTDISIFSTPEWLAAWWHSYGAGKELLALLFVAPDGELVGVAPLYLDKRAMFGRRLKVLRLVGDGSGDSDNLDIVIRSGYEGACAESFLSWLQRSGWDLCMFARLPHNSRFRRSLLACLHSSRWPVFELRSPHLFVNLPESWECYLRRLSPEFRPLLTRYPRRLRARHQVHIYRSSAADLEKNLLSLFSLHQRRWHERGQSGAFLNPDRRHFYRELAGSLLIRGWLEFWLLDLDGTTVAAHFCFRFGNTVYLLQEGFDPQYAHDKVGYALRAAMLEGLILQGVQRYDFLAGGEAHKFSFGAEESSYLTIEFARPATFGSRYLAAKRFYLRARQWARAKLPGRMVHVLRRLSALVGPKTVSCRLSQ